MFYAVFTAFGDKMKSEIMTVPGASNRPNPVVYWPVYREFRWSFDPQEDLAYSPTQKVEFKLKGIAPAYLYDIPKGFRATDLPPVYWYEFGGIN